MEKLLFIDACVRDERSRTKILCDVYLEEFLKKNPETEVEMVVLRNGSVQTHTMEKLDVRDDLVRKKDFSHSMFDLPAFQRLNIRINRLKLFLFIICETGFLRLCFSPAFGTADNSKTGKGTRA